MALDWKITEADVVYRANFNEKILEITVNKTPEGFVLYTEIFDKDTITIWDEDDPVIFHEFPSELFLNEIKKHLEDVAKKL